jgi:rhomboid protease GluP
MTHPQFRLSGAGRGGENLDRDAGEIPVTTPASTGTRLVLRRFCVVTIIFLGVVLYVAYRATTGEERARLTNAVLARLHEAKRAAARRDTKEPFREALRMRTPRALVTPAFAALNALVFLFMLAGSGSLGDPETLVRWGGNFGPRTTNGEWWRLAATAFIHPGALALLVNIAGLVPIGLVVERLAGPAAFAVTYLAAAACASLVSLSTHPVTVNAGAAAAIFGSYGLLLASYIWSIRHRSAVTIPLTGLKRLLPGTAAFVLYQIVVAHSDCTLHVTGLAAGLLCGMVLAKNIADGKPAIGLVAAVALAAGGIVVVCAVPMRGMADVRPEIERLAALEGRTASAYASQVERFKDGRLNADKLAAVIDGTITPEIRAAQTRLKALTHLPRGQQAMVNTADEYLRLRDESWRLRAEALHKSSMPTLRKADKAERASLDAFQRMQASQSQ